MMKHILCVGVMATLVAGCPAARGEAGSTVSSASASLGLTSTRDKGVVSVMTDPVLVNGRLVLKVAAHNPTAQLLQLQAQDVHVFTATGKPVAVLSLDQLIAEVRGTASHSTQFEHQASNYSRPSTSTSRTGELDVTGITGAGDTPGRSIPERSRQQSAPDPATQQQVEALKAGILQTVSIPPSNAAGGQLVTEKIKFVRKDGRALRVVVDFNGEQHEFNFEAPPAK